MKETRLLFSIRLLVCLFAFNVIVSAQTGNVSGTVTESVRNSNLSGVLIRVESQSIQTVSDASGKYLLQGIRPGKVTPTISKTTRAPMDSVSSTGSSDSSARETTIKPTVARRISNRLTRVRWRSTVSICVTTN